MTDNPQRSPITFRLNPEEEVLLRYHAKKQRITVSDLIRDSISEFITKKPIVFQK